MHISMICCVCISGGHIWSNVEMYISMIFNQLVIGAAYHARWLVIGAPMASTTYRHANRLEHLC